MPGRALPRAGVSRQEDPGPSLPQRREVGTALYETMRRVTRRLLEAARSTPGALSQVLKWVGAALVMGSCALLVYLGAVLLARLAVWAFFP